MQLEQLDQPLLAPGEPLPADLWLLLGIAEHPVAILPDETWLRGHTVDELLEFLNQRDETIRRMVEDPWNYGHEPHTWKVLDALCGFPWADPSAAAIADEVDRGKRAELEAKRSWCLQVRRALLKQDERISVLLLNGGNRGGKSEWAASRVIKLLFAKTASRAWVFHQDAGMSRQYQQPLLFKYLPPELKRDKGLRGTPTYVAYKPQTGFSYDHFTLPNHSDCDCRNYEQDIKKIQGGELDVAWCDELVPASWIKELKARIATRRGWLIITFTPVTGYTSTVKMFLDSAITVRETIAFVLPKDGGRPELELAMQGDDSTKWFDQQASQPEVPAGRKFERVPRVMRLPDKKSAVFFLHCFENPFGNPRELYALHSSEPSDYQKMKFYGLATKKMAGQFAFNGTIHCIAPQFVSKRGTNYHIVDPCSGRNFAMLWARVHREPIGLVYDIYREWPCPGKYVPGEGDLGAWAEPGEKMDGERGPAQRPLKWGHERYRQEIHRLEGRVNWEAPDPVEAEAFRFDKDDKPDPRPRRRPPTSRRPEEGEDIYERRMDSRFGASPTQTHEGQTTLIEEFAKIGLDFMPASGRDINEGTTMVNNLLNLPKPDERISTLNAPRLRISEDCQNVIFALQNWTGEDGQHGACKDFIDLLRYLVLAEPEDWSKEEKKEAA